MITIICITLLAYAILGKDIKALASKLKDIDWKSIANDIYQWLKPYAQKVGRTAARPLVIFYYVMNDENMSLTDRALVYAALLYTVSPVSFIPSSVYHFLGVLDEGAAVAFVYKKIKEKVTPEIKAKVDSTLNEWFGEKAVADVEVVSG